MNVSFVETMRGRVRDGAGEEHPLEFEVKAEAAGLGAWLRDGRTYASGLVRAPPWAVEAPIEGTLTIAPAAGSIAYSLAFRSEAGESLRLEGAKRVRWTDPLRTMTVLPVTLRAPDGRLLAAGVLHFALRDLVPFAASWLPGRRRAQRLLDVKRRAVERRLLAGG